MADPPRLLILIVLLVLCHISSSHGSPPPPLPSSIDFAACSQSFMCGGVSISYPLFLSGAAGQETAPYSCGYTDLKILCQGGVGGTETPILQLGALNYTVMEISYENRTIVLADTEALAGGKCAIVRHNVTLDDHGWLNYTRHSVDSSLNFFMDCYPLRDPEAEKYQITCTGSNTGSQGGASFVLGSDEYSTSLYHKLAGSCNLSVVVPVRGDFLTAGDHSLLPREYGVVVHGGFELEWGQSTATSGTCYPRCEKFGGRCAYSRKKELLGCLCSGGKDLVQDCNGSKKKPYIAGAVAGGGVLLLLLAGLIIAAIFVRKRKQRKVSSSSKLLKYSGSGGGPTHSRGCDDMESGGTDDLKTHHFSYEELEAATDSFSESRELGDGGFGTVYKGYLGDGRVVAVKRLYNNGYRRVEQFVNEADILSRLRHPNLVMFYGCTSCRSRELLLVYEYVRNGTVADHLHGRRAPERALTWPLRLGIAVESAAALTYLHAVEQPIVHRDVKTTNILLDADFHVKVADFGLSRLFPLDVTHVSTAPQGTPGYVDPEYHQCYQLTDKSDVYSFGVVLVELISSKPAVDITRKRNEINLAAMAITKIQNSQLDELLDHDLGYDSDPATRKTMTMVAELAFRCLQQNGEMRPPIKDVHDVLRSIQDECAVEKGGGHKKDKVDLDPPFSPDTVHAQWDSRKTTPNASQ